MVTISVSIRKRGESFQTDFTDPVTKKRERKTFATEREALQHKYAVEAYYKVGELPKAPMSAAQALPQKSMAEAMAEVEKKFERAKISDTLKRYLAIQEAQTKDKQNFKKNRYNYKYFYEACFEKGLHYIDQVKLVDLQEIQTKWLNEGRPVLPRKGSNKGKEKERGKPLSAATINRCLNAVAGFYSTCVDWELLPEEKNPFKKLEKLPEDETNTYLWSEEEASDVLARLPPWAQDYFIFLYTLGCRPKEASQVKIRDVDLSYRTVKLYSRKGGKLRERLVPLPEEILPNLETLIQDRLSTPKVSINDLVFVNSKGNAVATDVFGKQVRDARRALKLSEELHPYGLRHTLLTLLAKQNVNHRQLGQLAGHARMDTTNRYLHIDADALRKVIDMGSEIRKRQERDDGIRHKPVTNSSLAVINRRRV